MLSKKDNTEGAFAQLTDHLVLVETFLLWEALSTQNLIVPHVKRGCITEVNGALLRRGALEDQTVACTVRGWAPATSLLLDSLPRVYQALERPKVVLDMLLLGAFGAAKDDGTLLHVQLVLLELV